MKNETQHVFIIGSKGIPGKYGGYETFVDKLTEYNQHSNNIKYHVACKARDNKVFEYHNARCFNIKVPNTGNSQAIYYDVKALSECCKYIKTNKIKNPIIYILACRIGPFMNHFVKKIHKLGGKVYVNPDGHEWLRSKWSKPVRMYWKISEKLMIKRADLIICDSTNIENYIKDTYKKYKPNTTYIAYGAEIRKSKLNDKSKEVVEWFERFNIHFNEYYLIVGRFVPENNYETMIREFKRSNTKKDLVIITNDNRKLFNELETKYHINKDERIKFVGTVYDEELLIKIREKAFAYFHGHEVGGTNPSLLEALASTNLNLLLDVGFNKEVAKDSALYWTKEDYNLSKLINDVEQLTKDKINILGEKSTQRIKEAYSWEYIEKEYYARFKGSD